MKIVQVTGSRAIRVNTGNYEHYDIFHSVTLQVSEDAAIVDVRSRIKDTINELQEDELNFIANVAEKKKLESSIVFSMFE